MGRLRLTAVTVFLLFAAACGGEEQRQFTPIAPEDPGPIHVHALGVDPGDGSLFIATHTGLYRLAADAEKAERVGDLYQDTMGFTVAGPDRFLGSGHPDVRQARDEGLPPHLGLIESTDAGLTWSGVALLGEADFHVLRIAGEQVYGFDASNQRLLASADGGAGWERRNLPGFPPEPLLDLVVDPADPRHLIASTDSGLWDSPGGGATWTPLAPETGLLAWPARGRLIVVSLDGIVFERLGGARTLEPVGDLEGVPAALLAVSEQQLYAALHDGTIVASGDGGSTWAVRSTP